MPATVTHACFAKDVFDILPEGIKNRIDCSRIKTFGQGPDPFMFYNLFSLCPGKKIRLFSSYMHNNKSQDFFINLINCIKDNDLQNDMDICSFLAGFICHYALDSTVHPYIIYKTGVFDKKKRNTYKYNCIHHFMEKFIDNDLIKRRENCDPYTFRLDKYCFNNRPFSKDLNNILNITFDKTFNIKNIDKIYFKSLKQMKTYLYLFSRDPSGIKKNMYKLIDTFTSNKTFRFECISYHYPLDDKHNYLNLDHKLWRNPCFYNNVSDESFVDLYLKSIKFAKVLICASFDYIENKDIDLTKIFTNLSYLTGLDCDYKDIPKFFEF